MNPEIITVDNSVEIRITNLEDRQAIAIALVKAGYVVQQIDKQDPSFPLYSPIHYIKFSAPVNV